MIQLFKTRIFSGDESLKELNELVEKDFLDSKKIILCDSNTLKFCLPVLLENCTSLSKALIIGIPAGEENKNIDSAIFIWNKLNELQANRNSLLINLGGGVITDIGGFASSVFKRGIKFINIPTTLMAMVDASIGGKTGIDFEGLKNNIGTFALPISIHIYPDFLKSLSENEINGGYAEMIKHALIADENLWKKMLQSGSAIKVSLDAITSSVNLKCKIVSGDFEEKAERKLLNFGHTIGHAIETFMLNMKQYIHHGNAVANGMMAEVILSHQKGLMSETDKSQIINYLLNYFKPLLFNEADTNEIVALTLHDKKNESDKINFTLLTKPGSGLINNYCSINEITEAMKAYNKL